MSKLDKSENPLPSSKYWVDCVIGITGANGSLGSALISKFRDRGAYVIGFTHRVSQKADSGGGGANEMVLWSCGKEDLLESHLSKLDVLILNHGINPKGNQTFKDLNEAIEINALSTWRLIQRFEAINSKEKTSRRREVWINTSEAEIQPAFSPAYEVSKRLIGSLVSIRWNHPKGKMQNDLVIRKLILGPFRSDLNPLGIMNAPFVAEQILNQAELSFPLIIVTPNPITYILMPIVELLRAFYSRLISFLNW